MSSIQTTRMQPGFVPAAQVSRATLVELATKAMQALEEFMLALTPADVQPLPPKQPTPISDPPYATKDGGTPKNFHGNPQCPECGDETVRRTRRSNGSVFYGCINYPTCKATVDAQKFSTRKGAMSQ